VALLDDFHSTFSSISRLKKTKTTGLHTY